MKREQQLSRMVVVPVNAASRVPDDMVETGSGIVPAKDIYENITTYLWAGIRGRIDNGTLSLVKVARDGELIGQISCRKYRISSRGRTVLESKEDMKKKGLSSPDRADALALCLYEKKRFDLRGLIN